MPSDHRRRGGGKGGKRTPYDLRPYVVTGSKRRAGKHHLFSRVRAHTASRRVPVGTAIAHKSEYIRVESESRRYLAKNPRDPRTHTGKTVKSVASRPGRTEFLRGDGHYRSAERPTAAPSTTGAGEAASVRRVRYLGGESFTRVAEENYGKKKEERGRGEGKNEQDDVSLSFSVVSKFEPPLAPLRDYSPTLGRSFVRPICRGYAGRNKVYSFSRWPRGRPLSRFSHFSSRKKVFEKL